MNESIITGESEPIHKKQKDLLIGGSLLLEGTVKAQVTAGADQSVLANIINLVKELGRPASRLTNGRPDQRDICSGSAGHRPAYLLLNYYFLSGSSDHALRDALMRSIAVLVIACPCAMGLATPQQLL